MRTFCPTLACAHKIVSFNAAFLQVHYEVDITSGLMEKLLLDTQNGTHCLLPRVVHAVIEYMCVFKGACECNSCILEKVFGFLCVGVFFPLRVCLAPKESCFILPFVWMFFLNLHRGNDQWLLVKNAEIHSLEKHSYLLNFLQHKLKGLFERPTESKGLGKIVFRITFCFTLMNKC